MIYKRKYKWKCGREKCYRRVRVPNDTNCMITIEGRTYGMCKYLSKEVAKRIRVSKYALLPLGQVIYTLVCLKDGKRKMSELDKRIIDEFVEWLKKRFGGVRIMRTVRDDEEVTP